MTPFAPADLSAEFLAWIERAHGQVSVDAERWPGVYVSLEAGEVRYLFERDDDGWTTVFESLRGGDPRRRFRTPSLDIVERFLANEAGPAARFHAGRPADLRVPFEIDELPPGARLERLTDGPRGGFERLTVNGVVIGDFGFGPRGALAHASAVRAAHYGPATLAEIGESYLSVDGRPLFGIRSGPTQVTTPAGPVVTAADARLCAATLLVEVEADAGRPLALWEGQFGRTGVEDHGDVWTVAWNSVDYLASGRVVDQVLSGPIVVPKDGSQPFLLGTWSASIDEMLAARRAEIAGSGS